MKQEEKVLRAKLPKAEFIRAYLLIFNGGLRLTENELNVTESFLTIYLRLKEEGLSKENIDLLLFNPQNRKTITETLEISSANFNNIISSLKKKGVIIANKAGGSTISDKFIPVTKLTFVFDII
jgi:hypothetical protein